MNLSQMKQKLRSTLKLYGCTDWNVNLTLSSLGEDIVDEDENVVWQQQGLCTATARYRTAVIQVNPTLDDKQTSYVIAHEAAHVLLNEMRETFQRICGMLPYELRDAAQELFTDAEEHTCDRLAKSPMHKEPQ